MKKISFVTILCIAFLYVKAQNSNPWPTSGNVGIGTTSPGNNIGFTNVDADNGTSGITWYNPSSLLYGIYRGAGSWSPPNFQQLNISWLTGITLNPGNSYGKSYVEVIGGGLRVSSGNVGIGTTNAQSPLDLTGSMQLRDYSNTIGGGSSISFSSYGAISEHPGSRIRNYLINAQGAEYSISKLILSSYYFGYKDELTLYNGNVGIGTQNPDQKLSVAGTIHSQAVKVDMNGWSDYVFKPNYNLSTLKEVKAYVANNHHLPNTPSADEIIKNGVNVGDMLKIQQKKIEELTLYLIEKDSEIKAQNIRLKKLENKIKKM